MTGNWNVGWGRYWRPHVSRRGIFSGNLGTSLEEKKCLIKNCSSLIRGWGGATWITFCWACAFNLIFHHSLLCSVSLKLDVWGIDYVGKLDTDPEELVQSNFLKWLLGMNKYCNNNACRAETGMFPLRIKTQWRTVKFWLT